MVAGVAAEWPLEGISGTGHYTSYTAYAIGSDGLVLPQRNAPLTYEFNPCCRKRTDDLRFDRGGSSKFAIGPFKPFQSGWRNSCADGQCFLGPPKQGPCCLYLACRDWMDDHL